MRASKVTDEDVAAIARMFAAVDAIDARIAERSGPLPMRGSVPCPNCGGRLLYVQLTPIKGAAQCVTRIGRDLCVSFSPLAPVV